MTRRPLLISAVCAAGALTLTGAGIAATAAEADTTPAQDASVSANWAGYAAGASETSTSETRFSHVAGSWVQPSVNCSTGQGDSAFWVGLGGASQTSQALEQTGTSADCDANGQASYYAWYELVPAAPVKLDLAIKPGDHISSSVDVNGTNVTIALKDTTTGQSATKQLSMDSPDVSSAEWIAEAPSTCLQAGECQPLPLSNFGTVTFTSASATANGHTGSISDPAWAAQPMELSPESSGDVSFDGGGFGDGGASSDAGAVPTTLSSDGSSFSVAVQDASDQQSGTPGEMDPGAGGWGGDGGQGAGGWGDPGTGQSIDPGTGQSIDPGSGQSIDPSQGGWGWSDGSGQGDWGDPGSGESIDPSTGQSIDPGTGQSIDPGQGGWSDGGDGSGQSVDPSQGGWGWSDGSSATQSQGAQGGWSGWGA